MKKMICSALACLCLLALCGGCSKTGPEQEAAFQPEVLQSLRDAGVFSENLEELDPALLFALYGDPSDYEGSMLYYSTGATSEVAAVIVTKDASQAEGLKETLSAWVDAQIEAVRNYQPAEVEKLEHAILEARGSSVLLVVAADWEAAAGIIDQA